MTDPVDELARRAAEADEEARAVEQRKRDAAQAEADEASAEAAAKQRDAAKAPTSFVRSTRFFYLASLGVVGGVSVVVLLLEGIAMPWDSIGGAAAAWTVVVAGLALDHAMWRRRLPFTLVGYDRIGGTDRTGDDMAPWVAFTVQIIVKDDVPVAAKEAVRRTLQILASRVNARQRKLKDARFGGEQVWRVQEEGPFLARGQATFGIYTTRLLEKWLRRDVRLLEKIAPVERVVVDARYTGRGFRLPSGD